MSRVYITGLSAITPSGQTLDATWNAVCDGKIGWGQLDANVHEGVGDLLGGEVSPFKPRALVSDKKILKLVSRYDVLGIHAAQEVIKHSGMLDYRDGLASPDAFNDRTGVYVGSPGNKFYQQYDFLPLIAQSEQDMGCFADNLFSTVHPMWLLKILPNNVLAYAGIQHGFKGPNQNITNHVASGMQAVIEGYCAILSGQADRVVVVAYDHGIEAQGLSYYEKIGVLSRNGLKPFDSTHDGTVMSEGACALVLESEKSVTERQAKTYGELVSYASSSDAQGIFSLEEDGAQLERTVKTALDKAKCQATDLGVITAHGNGNPMSDDIESRLYQSLSKSTPVTAYKWSLGHLLSASGLMDTIFTVLSLKNKIAPGIANLNTPAEAATALAVSASKQAIDSPLGLVVCRGFGGMNSCLVVKSND